MTLFVLFLVAQFIFLCHVTFWLLNYQVQIYILDSQDNVSIQGNVLTEISSDVEDIFEFELIYTDSDFSDNLSTSVQDSSASSLEGYSGDISYDSDA